MGRESLAELRTLAQDCVCPTCLQGYAEPQARMAATGIGVKAVPDPGIRARGLEPLWLVAGVILLVASLLIGLSIGPAGIGPAAIVGSSISHIGLFHASSRLSPVDEAILWQVRAPRVFLAALVGGMLAVSGAAYQGVFRNPLADPYLLGVAAGAGLGATLAISFGLAATGGGLVLPLAAFVGASLAVAAAYVLGRSADTGRNTPTLILAGLVIALFMTAVQTLVQQQRSETLREVYSWILGGFGNADWESIALISPYVVLSTAVVLLHGRIMDVLRLGDHEARALGLHADRARLVLVIAATLGTAAAVSVSGLIGFVGIIVPHSIRLIVSPSYRAIVPLSTLCGAGFLVLTDILARTILSPAELPIGVVTAFFGAPFFALVLRSTRGTPM